MTNRADHLSTTASLRLNERLTRIQRALFPSRDGHGFFQNWVHHLPVIIGLSLGVALLDYYECLEGFKSMALDSYLLAQHPRRSDQVIIVTIGDEEYRSPELFHGRSPLDSEKLGLILQAIAAGKPRLIAVDLDTSPEDKKAAYEQLADMTRADGWPPVIWSCDGEAEDDHPGGHDPPVLRVIPAMAGTSNIASGLITMPCDADGVIRRYCRTFQVTSPNHPEPAAMDSLPWVIAKRLRHDESAAPEPNELLMNFAGDRYSFFHITAQTVLDSVDSKARREFWFSEKSPVREKIVLLGGTYRAARDIHPTPAGRVDGVELLAMAIESELQGTGIRFVQEAVAIMIDILFGSLLVYFNWRFVSPRAVFLNLLAVAALALIASYITFNTLGYWLNFALVLVGIWLHHQHDIVHELPRLHREVHELRSRLSRYERPEGKQTPEVAVPAAIPVMATLERAPEPDNLQRPD
jgi:CHASE2 domain-containing sensor protein